MASSVVPDLYSLYHFTRSIPHDVYPSISPTNPTLALGPSQKTILITGGGSGIGLATAKYYAIAGAENIIITGRRKDALEDAAIAIKERNSKTTVHVMQADVSDKDAVRKIWKDVKERIGKVDVLVNNAGRGGNRTSLGEGNVEDWMDVLHTNLFGVYLMCDAYAASLAPTQDEEAEAKEGTVINVSSAMAFVNMPATSSYTLSKAAVTRFTELLHAERPNIRAFSVHPGIIPTALSSLGAAAKDTVELAAGLNLYLASPRAEFLRGRYTTANWDVDEMEKHQGEIVESDMLKTKLEIGVDGYGAEGHVWKEQGVGA